MIKKTSLFNSDIPQNRGFAFPAIIATVLVLTISGFAFIYLSQARRVEVQNDIKRSQALWLAEAGLERAKEELKIKMQAEGTWENLFPSGGNNINQIVDEADFGNGTYEAEVEAIVDAAGDPLPDETTVRASGTVGDFTRTIQADVRGMNINPGESALFSGGMSADQIRGSATICGSVYIGGTGLSENELVLELIGYASIQNYYAGIGSDLKDRIPDLPRVRYQGGYYESLRTNVWVMRGEISVDNQIGDEHKGNSYKRPVDGIYLPKGKESIRGGLEYFSDRGIGYSTFYDELDLPDLTNHDDIFGENNYALTPEEVSLIIEDDAIINANTGVEFDTNTLTGDTINNSFHHDGSTLTVEGAIVVQGNLEFGSQPGGDEIHYEGNGVLIATGDVFIRNSLLTVDFADENGGNMLAVLSEKNMEFTRSNMSYMGFFYGEELYFDSGVANSIFVGSFGAEKNIEQFQNPGTIYQVPGLTRRLPFMNIPNNWRILTRSWEVIE